ncbi:MAG: hypothetical protein Kow0010_08890 [Dehalococcoidia bacterium]
MAIYEYFCPTCRKTFERRLPMSRAAATATCDAGHRAERTISAFAFASGTATVTALQESPGGCCGGGGCACSN